MSAKIIDGKALAQSVRTGLKEKVEQFKLSSRAPGLTVILVGDNPASQVYVRNKIKACSDVGITSKLEKLPAETSEAELLALLEKLNADDSVDGILVQLPLPRHINEQKVIETIRADKDVDGFHVANVGSVVTGIGGFRSCTPYGVIKMLESVDYPLTGAHALVIGRSNIVGKPMAALLLRENGTVTVAHSRTKSLADVTRRADILIVAIGKERFITSDYVKKHAVVIDVGMHRDAENHLCGDVDFADVEPVASAITPVPGGVGPMTIAMLMNNCVETVRS
ncbi:MAG TPA: bifunctional methylenetetrahydrofolate dehydrogenase/methenyltetrahydrofolate cyclohydrolase FolD [Sutterellaceae bacterium]|nr:bifunctional methylenetetrahydrofolate dehydrogenase/methenyltetrahydrofolate cyclohydrolase FolD [Sutterellaceae bacterium]